MNDNKNINKRDTKMTKITGKTMNKVYDGLKTMTVDQINKCKDAAYTKFSSGSYQLNLFLNQCNFAIDKKQAGKW